MLGRGFQKALDIAAAGEMLADGAQHDHAHARVFVERLKYQAKLVALWHLDDIKRRAMQDDVGALLVGGQFDFEAIEHRQARIVEGHWSHAAVPCECALSSA